MEKFKSETTKGFTLIELLVVIAIIGILSAVVLSSLNSARIKGNDAKVKSQLSRIRSAAELYYDNNSYAYGSAVVGTEAAVAPRFGNGCSSNMFAEPATVGAYTMTADYPSGTSMKCDSTGAAYVVTANLNAAGQYWCVDSKGNSRLTTTGAVQANNATVCP